MNWALLQNSFLVGVSATVLSVSLGFIGALWLGGLPERLRAGFLAAAIVALALPPFLVTNCWLHFLGHTGVWHRWLPLDIFSVGGTIWILSLLLWPLSLLLVWGAWQRLEVSQLESDLLVKGWPFLRALLLPLARGAVAEAALVTFVLALNNFAVPAILQVKVFPAEMWVRFNTSFDTWGALRLCLPLVLGPLLLLTWLARKDIPWPHRQTAVPARLFRRQLGIGWFWSCGACSLLVWSCSTLLPLFQILSLSRTWSELPGALAAGQSAVWNSFWYAIAAATAIVGIALWTASGIENRSAKTEDGKQIQDRNPNQRLIGASQTNDSSAPRFGLRTRSFFRSSALGLQILDWLTWLAFLLPGVLLGLGLIALFNHGWTSRFYRSGGIVILAFVFRYLAIGRYSASRATEKVDRDLMDAARVDGATRWQMARHVIWPQIARPVRVSWYIVFVLCLWDVESMILVVPPGGETLALRVFNLLHYGHNAQVNALCLTLLAVALLPLVLQGLWGAARIAWRHVGFSPGPTTGLLGVAALSALLLTSCSPAADVGALRSEIFSNVQIIGSRGVGVGQLNKPRSVAVDAADNLYVVDMTGRVQKFSTNGTLMLSWQMPQTDLGKPKGMCRDRAGNILLVEPHYSRVNVFSQAGQLLVQWGSHGTKGGQLSLPRAVAVDSHGQVFVSEYQEAERVQIFVLDANRLRVHAVTGGDTTNALPRWLGEFGQAGTGPGEFNRPEGLCVDAQDRLYVADSCNHRIQVFSNAGKFLRSYGKPGKGLGELSYPYDICVDSAGRQYVCEFGNSRIQVFDAQDRPVEIIGGPGDEPGRFNNPWGVALDSAGNLYVADSQNHRVQKLVRRP